VQGNRKDIVICNWIQERRDIVRGYRRGEILFVDTGEILYVDTGEILYWDAGIQISFKLYNMQTLT